ncbi:MAG: Gfo/Idh/MocA family oxidoreductase [Anaerolineae bacterium]
MKTYRVAVVGTGAIVNSHLRAIQSAGDRAELVAAVDINEAAVQKFCETNGVPNAYTSVADMLAAQKPDLVCVATPPATHKDICVQALDGGAWVYCEKPLCGSLAQFDEIQAAEARTGRYVNTVFQWRFGSAVKHIKKLMAQGVLGRPLVSVCNTVWYRPQAYYDVSWRGTYASEFGGPTVGLGIHLMDLCFFMMGDWQEVQANIATLDRKIEIEDISMAMVRFENGALGSIVNSALSPRQETYLRLDFQKASLEVTALYRASNENWRFSLPPDVVDPEVTAAWESLDQDIMGAHDQQFKELLDSMDAQTRPAVSGDEARRILEFIASLYKSAATRQVVRRGELTPDDPFYYSNSGKKA